MAAKIRRNKVLKYIDIKETPSGDQISSSIVFIKKNGERVFLPRAVATGLPFSLKTNRMRGVMPIDSNLSHLKDKNFGCFIISWQLISF